MLIIKVNITQWIESLFLAVCPSHHEVSLCIDSLYVNSWQTCIFAILVFPMKLVFNTGFFSCFFRTLSTPRSVTWSSPDPFPEPRVRG